MRPRWLAPIGVTLGIAITGVAYAQPYLKIWPRLERAANRFPTQPGMTVVESVREGTTFCPISCDEARITIVYRTPLSPEQACARLRETIDQAVGPTTNREYLAGCGYEAALPSVFDRAFVVAGAEPARDLLGGVGPSWKTKIAVPKTDESVAWVQLSSGLD
jgi:hypothetical protein